MKSNNKKRISCLIAGILTLSMVGGLCACGGKPDDGGKQDPFLGGDYIKAPEGMPDYSAHENESMMIGAWHSQGGMRYTFTAEELLAAKEAGIDFLIDYRIVRQNEKSNKANMEAIEAAGMKLFVSIAGLQYSDIAPGGGWDFVYEYLSKDYVLGIVVEDEPGTSAFEKHEESAAAFRKDFPDKLCYINFLPNYANAGQLGGQDLGVTFDKYVDKISESFESLTHYSYDFYPLAGQMSAGMVMNYTLNSLWCASLEKFANAAKADEKDLWVFIQSMSFGANNRSPQSVNDITLQNYINMCYGARVLQYFSFTTPDTNEFGEYDVGMLDRDRQKTDNYDYVKAANEELKTFDSVYLQFEWENVMPLVGTVFGDNLNSGFDMLKTHMTSSEYFTATANADTVIGQFHDANGYKGYMVAGLTDPMEDITDTVSMTFKANRVLVYTGGQSKVVEIPTGVYTFNLDAGDGAFLIPFNA